MWEAIGLILVMIYLVGMLVMGIIVALFEGVDVTGHGMEPTPLWQKVLLIVLWPVALYFALQ